MWPLLHVEQQGQFIEDSVNPGVGDCFFMTAPDGTQQPAEPTSKDCDMFGRDATALLYYAMPHLRDGTAVPNDI